MVEPDGRSYAALSRYAAYSAGTAEVPTVGFSLGKESDAHMVDEHIHLEDLERVGCGYKGIIESTLIKKIVPAYSGRHDFYYMFLD